MTELVTIVLIFLAVGLGFLFFNLLLGWVIRPAVKGEEKDTIYECGEPPVGSSWIQFDLRFYVVALLFVIFDVEMAFFFPWATVFGGANRLADEQVPMVEKAEIHKSLTGTEADTSASVDPAAAKALARLAFIDILVFFGVLLVGFAYLWKRGDLEWVRSMAAQPATGPPAEGGTT